jgi:hypothetical protein
MANTKTGPRWVLDAAEAVVVSGTFLNIKSIRFVGTTDDDNAALTDAAGVSIWKAKLGDVSVDGYQDETFFGDSGIIVNGLTVSAIDHGTIYVYLGKL